MGGKLLKDIVDHVVLVLRAANANADAPKIVLAQFTNDRLDAVVAVGGSTLFERCFAQLALHVIVENVQIGRGYRKFARYNQVAQARRACVKMDTYIYHWAFSRVPLDLPAGATDWPDTFISTRGFNKVKSSWCCCVSPKESVVWATRAFQDRLWVQSSWSRAAR